MLIYLSMLRKHKKLCWVLIKHILCVTWNGMQILKFYITRLSSGFMLIQNLTSSCQKHYFIHTLIVPTLFYNIGQWFYSSTKGERGEKDYQSVKILIRMWLWVFLDIVNQVITRIEKTARIFIMGDTCYKWVLGDNEILIVCLKSELRDFWTAFFLQVSKF